MKKTFILIAVIPALITVAAWYFSKQEKGIAPPIENQSQLEELFKDKRQLSLQMKARCALDGISMVLEQRRNEEGDRLQGGLFFDSKPLMELDGEPHFPKATPSLCEPAIASLKVGDGQALFLMTIDNRPFADEYLAFIYDFKKRAIVLQAKGGETDGGKVIAQADGLLAEIRMHPSDADNCGECPKIKGKRASYSEDLLTYWSKFGVKDGRITKFIDRDRTWEAFQYKTSFKSRADFENAAGIREGTSEPQGQWIRVAQLEGGKTCVFLSADRSMPRKESEWACAP